jgi:hypothetical protein
MDANTGYEIIKYACNKNQQGYVNPNNYNLVINQASNSLLNALLGEFQQYQYGKGQPRYSYSNNQTIRNRLASIITQPSTISVDGTGLSAYPTGYIQVDAMYTSDGDRIRFCPQDKKYSFLKSVIDPIASNPFYILQENGIQFYPINIVGPQIAYIKSPKPINWAYQLDSNGRAIYTAGIQGVPVLKGGSGYSSATVAFSAPTTGITATGTVTISGGKVTGIVMTEYGTGYTNTVPTVTFVGVGGTGASLGAAIVSNDFIWHDVDCLDVIARALRIIGVNLQDNQAEAYANEIKQNGQ